MVPTPQPHDGRIAVETRKRVKHRGTASGMYGGCVKSTMYWSMLYAMHSRSAVLYLLTSYDGSSCMRAAFSNGAEQQPG